jgi:uncharacterized protein YlxW (UPF0749 family)
MVNEPAGAALPARFTQPLLTLITQQSLDEDYQAAAARRQRTGRHQRPGFTRLAAAVVAVFGLLITVAAVQSARNADVVSASREQLINRIGERNEQVAGLQRDIARMRTSVTAAESANDRLGGQLGAANADLARLRRLTSFSAISGPGVRAVVTDAPGGSASGQVRDDDLALLVNGLFAAGAEGVSVNGNRMSSLSALRNTGDTIRVNFVSLSPPYVIEAVGPVETLQADLAETRSGQRFRAIVERYGMGFTMDNERMLDLEAAPSGMMRLRHVTPALKQPSKPSADQELAQ